MIMLSWFQKTKTITKNCFMKTRCENYESDNIESDNKSDGDDTINEDYWKL